MVGKQGVSLSHNFSPIKVAKCLGFSFSSFASPSTTWHFSNPSLPNYLVNTFGFSETAALSASQRFAWAKNSQKIQAAINLLQKFGFSDTHIRKTVQVTTQILFADVKKILEPKLRFFEELGLIGSDLGLFISKNSPVLTSSLERRLMPNCEILKKILSHDRQALIRTLYKCIWLLSKHPELRLLANISLMQSYGIVGTQLSMLLKIQPSLFISRDSNLRHHFHKLEKMGFSSDSRMLVHGLFTVSCMSSKTIERKFDIFRGFGFLEDECVLMFRKAPGLLRNSQEKLKIGFEFLMEIVGLDKSVLVHQPGLLLFSMEKRVVPRFIVLEILKSKKLLKKNPSFINVMHLPEHEFLDKYISKFKDNAEELLIAYKGGILDVDSSEESEEECDLKTDLSPMEATYK